MTLSSVPRRRPQPDLRASADPSARLSDTREATSRGRGRVAGRLAGPEGCRPGGVVFPNPLRDPWILSCPSEASGNIRVLSTLDFSRAQVQRGHGPPREKEPPINAHANPAPRERPRQSLSFFNLAGGGRRGVGRRGGPGPAEGPKCCPPNPKFPLCPGRGFAQVCWAMPFPEPDSWAGREGRVIDRLNYRLISYLRPRALIGCSLTSSNPAAPRWAREGGGCGWRCASDKPESHFQSQVDFVPTIGGVAPPLHGRGQTSSSAPLLMEPHLLGLLLGLLLCGTRVLAGYPIWW